MKKDVNELKSEVLHLRMPHDQLKLVKKIALAAGLPTATQARLLIRESLQHRKLM